MVKECRLGASYPLRGVRLLRGLVGDRPSEVPATCTVPQRYQRATAWLVEILKADCGTRLVIRRPDLHGATLDHSPILGQRFRRLSKSMVIRRPGLHGASSGSAHLLQTSGA